MARSKNTAEKNEQSSVTVSHKTAKYQIRKKEIHKGGKVYKYYEGRITVGYDKSGKQKTKSITGKTEKEVRDKLAEIRVEVNNGDFVNSNNYTVAAWMKKWYNDCLNHVTARTAFEYRYKAEKYIIPSTLGSVKLQQLTPLQVQSFINSLSNPKEEGGKKLNPKYIKDIYGVLHRALEVAVSNKLLSSNPADNRSLPRIDSVQRIDYDIDDIKDFLAAINNHIHERYYKLLLMTGMREAEALGLTWDCVDFEHRIIHVKQQLQRNRKTGEYTLVAPKWKSSRDLPMGDMLYDLLQEQKTHEKEKRRICGDCWQAKNLVFSNPTGGYLSYRTVYDCYKRIVKKIGMPEKTIHDLRHAYTMLALRNGDDVKTVQSNLGHRSQSITLNVYAYSTETLKQESGAKMSDCICGLSGKSPKMGN